MLADKEIKFSVDTHEDVIVFRTAGQNPHGRTWRQFGRGRSYPAHVGTHAGNAAGIHGDAGRARKTAGGERIT